MRNSRLLTVVEGGVQGCLCARGVDAGGVCVCVCHVQVVVCVRVCVCVHGEGVSTSPRGRRG